MPHAAPTTATEPAPVPEVVDETWLRAQHRGVWRLLRFLGAPPALADDLTQETFLRLVAASVEDRGPRALAAWLRSTAVNLFRSSNRPARVGVDLASPDELDSAWLRTCRDGSGDRYLAALEACLERLDPRTQRALEARHGQDIARADIAGELGIGIEGVKTLLRRGRAKLRACIERRSSMEDAR